ncbi:Fanconi-associated nuclease 1 [Hypsizygus marmoreus]|uniref:Fanconi-associated nuclease n=1 Tax=Hypsizygus marmoreus TaxID=39966 RepID=A0A369JLM6_HYPMA|nr:Fanconi-associated nuclease 1 [Hypsizygus marmoreus]
MSMNTPTAAALYELFYGAERLDDTSLERDIEELDSIRRNNWEEPTGCRRPSIYVDAFEHMINTVYEHEQHLLSEKELDILEAFTKLSYNARYCLVRLILRKSDTWHTVASMEKFKKEVGEEGLKHAIEHLCQPLRDMPLDTEISVKVEEPEIIDLTLDSDYEDEEKPIIENAEAGPSRLGAPVKHEEMDLKPSLDALRNPPEWDSDFEFFCEDETKMMLYEVLCKLNGDQLRQLVKHTKTKPLRNTNPEMISALLIHASTQSVLDFAPTHKHRDTKHARPDGLRQTTLPFLIHRGKNKARRQSAEDRLMEMALKMLGKSVRVNTDLYWLTVRLNVIYDRCTEYPKSLLLPSLLTSFKKRTYPEYKYARDRWIWANRRELLDYVEALRLEAAIEEELEPPKAPRLGTKTPVPGNNKNHFVTPDFPTPGGRTMETSMSGSSAMRCTKSPLCKEEEGGAGEPGELVMDVQEEEVPVKVQSARRVKQVFDEQVFPRWTEFVAVKHEQGMRERAPGLERFEPGFVYTRIFSKAMRALATLKCYKEEAIVLQALLTQRHWRRGKRAKWYERLAIIQMQYLGKEDDGVVEDVLRQAMEGVLEALKDEDTGLVFRPAFVRRLRRLEKKLKVPVEERCRCEGELRMANTVSFSAERLFTTAASLKLDANGRPIDGAPANGNGNGVRAYFAPVAGRTPGKADKENKPSSKGTSDDWKWKGKSIWKGLNGEEVNVEIRALQYYESMGYKGFHSESRILTTIFALLFWDIIFADVRGAFETPHQTAPLDLAEDSFYRARRDAIEARLDEIRSVKGRACEILARHDEAYREKKTWCVGVRWDICERQDLLEIVECFGGESLAIICRLFCEDYAGRSSGVPDLIIWDYTKGLCKFVEVKGPGDRPQENQKLWFDSLLGAGANVEICKVLDINQPPPASKTKKPRKARAQTRRGTKKGKAPSDSDAQMEDQPEQLDDASWGSPHETSTRRSNPGSSILGTKRRRPPDENEDDELPIFGSAATPPTSPSAPAARRGSHGGSILPPPKKQKPASVS